MTNCYAQHINNLGALAAFKIGNEPVQFTAPHSILANANYTTSLNVYRYNDLYIEIIERDEPDKIAFQVVKRDSSKLPLDKVNSYKLPWWSHTAPQILSQLDFSQVKGDEVTYKIAQNYRLNLLPNQGCWGKVYVLEQLDSNGSGHIICAVKVLLTKTDDRQEYFRLRHTTEIANNFIATDLNIAIKTYGIIENDPDHYLMFLEYGQYAKDRFAKQDLEQTLQQLDKFIDDLNTMHAEGYAHGDLNLGNLLYVGNIIKLCDWFSLTNIQQTTVSQYRYIGDDLPPEALRAFYYDKALNSVQEEMQYATVTADNKPTAYWLHPIAADRFCFGVNLMKIFALDLFKIIESKPFTKDFNAYSPQSLDFWSKYAAVIREVQFELLSRANAINDPDNIQAKMLSQISDYIDLDPMKRL